MINYLTIMTVKNTNSKINMCRLNTLIPSVALQCFCYLKCLPEVVLQVRDLEPYPMSRGLHASLHMQKIN